MNRIPVKFLTFLALLLAAYASLSAQTAKSGTLKNQYQNIEVNKFDVQQGIDFPANYLDDMMKEISTELKEIHKFQEVLGAADTPANADRPTLQLSGTVTKYKPGSRAKRYFVGFGAGQTKVVAHVKFVDKASGKILLERDVDGKIAIGVFGGDSKTSLKDVGKEIAEVTKKTFF
jgi:hypothetical protein